MEKTRFKLNICGVDVTVSGDVDRDGAEAIAERVRVRMEEVLNNAYGAHHRESGGHCGHEPERGAFPHGGRLNQAREEADALAHKRSKEFAGADGLKARLSESGNEARRFAGKAAPCRKTAPKLHKRKRKKRKPLPKMRRTRQLQNRSTCRPATCATPCCPITATKRGL